MINTKNSDYYVKSVVTLKVTTGFFAFSNLNICIAEVKEKALGENAAFEGGLSQNVGQTSFV